MRVLLVLTVSVNDGSSSQRCNGGTMVGVKQTSPDEKRASNIQGGQTHHLAKATSLRFRQRPPHWWKEVGTKTVAYYAVNIEN